MESDSDFHIRQGKVSLGLPGSEQPRTIGHHIRRKWAVESVPAILRAQNSYFYYRLLCHCRDEFSHCGN